MNAKWMTPVVSVLDENGHIDLDGNSIVYNNLIQNAIDGLLILGSIGEFYALSFNEKKEMIHNAVHTVDYRVPLLVGTGSMIVDECVRLSEYALDQGADGIIIIPPYYFSLSDEAIVEFYASIAEQISGPIYLYNFPERTGYDVKPHIVLQLALKYPNIVGIKDTVADMGHTRQLIQLVKKVRPDFEVYSGFDEFFAHNVLSGGDGCIAGISNFAPKLCTDFVCAIKKQDIALIRSCQAKIDSLMCIYNIGKHFIPIIKKAMIISGIPITDSCKVPIPCATEAETEEIRKLLEKVNCQ